MLASWTSLKVTKSSEHGQAVAISVENDLNVVVRNDGWSANDVLQSRLFKAVHKHTMEVPTYALRYLTGYVALNQLQTEVRSKIQYTGQSTLEAMYSLNVKNSLIYHEQSSLLKGPVMFLTSMLKSVYSRTLYRSASFGFYFAWQLKQHSSCSPNKMLVN